MSLAAPGCAFTPTETEVRSSDSAAQDAALPSIPDAGAFDGGTTDAGETDPADAEPDDGGVGCGDGTVDQLANEACDDGNRIAEDGCENNCQITANWQCNRESPSICEPTPVLSLTGTTAEEGTMATVLAHIDERSEIFDVRFQWFTTSGTAVSPDDYVAVSPTDVLIPAGQTEARLEVQLEPDVDPEGEEALRVQFIRPVGAIAGLRTVEITILNDGRPTRAGLVAQYPLDEAKAGVPTDRAFDAISGFDLDLTAVGPDSPAFFNEDGAGLRWQTAGEPGRAEASMDNSPLQTALDGQPAATIEAVVDIAAVPAGGSTIATITGGPHGELSATVLADGQTCFAVGQSVRRCWAQTAVITTGRHVVTFVFSAAATRRMSLYIDGVDQGEGTGDDAGGVAALSVPDGATFVVGNQADGGASIEGDLRYLAVYAVALQARDIQRNAVLLSADDDP